METNYYISAIDPKAKGYRVMVDCAHLAEHDADEAFTCGMKPLEREDDVGRSKEEFFCNRPDEVVYYNYSSVYRNGQTFHLAEYLRDKDTLASKYIKKYQTSFFTPKIEKNLVQKYEDCFSQLSKIDCSKYSKSKVSERK